VSEGSASQLLYLQLAVAGMPPNACCTATAETR